MMKKRACLLYHFLVFIACLHENASVCLTNQSSERKVSYQWEMPLTMPIYYLFYRTVTLLVYPLHRQTDNNSKHINCHLYISLISLWCRRVSRKLYSSSLIACNLWDSQWWYSQSKRNRLFVSIFLTARGQMRQLEKCKYLYISMNLTRIIFKETMFTARRRARQLFNFSEIHTSKTLLGKQFLHRDIIPFCHSAHACSPASEIRFIFSYPLENLPDRLTHVMKLRVAIKVIKQQKRASRDLGLNLPSIVLPADSTLRKAISFYSSCSRPSWKVFLLRHPGKMAWLIYFFVKTYMTASQ